MQFMDNEMLMKAEIWCHSEAVRTNNTYLRLWYWAIKVYQYETHYASREFSFLVGSHYNENFINEIKRIRN